MAMFSSIDLAIVVPTRNRPKNVEKLFKSLLKQSNPPGIIILVANGERLDNVIQKEWGDLNILYIYTDVVGQVKQRNLGLEKAADYPLVACLDDDIELLPRSLNELLGFWNTHPDRKDIAAVGFNIQNLPSSRDAWLKRTLLGIPSIPGRVLPCGVATLVANVNQDVKAQWVNGGTTVWRTDVLMAERNSYDLTGKAYAEDIFFSYPLSQKYDFYIASKAKVLHNDLYFPFSKSKRNAFSLAYQEEIKITQARLYLVRSNDTLSELGLLSFWLRNALLKFFAGIVTLSPQLVGASLGSFHSLLDSLFAAPETSS